MKSFLFIFNNISLTTKHKNQLIVDDLEYKLLKFQNLVQMSKLLNYILSFKLLFQKIHIMSANLMPIKEYLLQFTSLVHYLI